MEGSKRLVPYSVYLDASVHEALKEKARSRGASKMVRDAMDIIHKDELAGSVSINERKVADHLIDQIEELMND